MNTNQYTQKTLEALQAAQQLAVEYQHNALEPEHLLHALASHSSARATAPSPSCINSCNISDRTCCAFCIV